MPHTENKPAGRSAVLAIDVGSSSVRALLFDASGMQIDRSETQLAYKQTITPDGGAEIDADLLFDLASQCIDGVIAFASDHNVEIFAVAATSFWHGLLGLDAQLSPVTPVYMWSDKRSGADARALASEIDPAATHQSTGCRLHSSYWPAKLRWLAREHPDTFARASRWVSLTDLMYQRWFGDLRTSISMASGTGLLNANTLTWHESVLTAAGTTVYHFPPICDRTDAFNGLVAPFAERWSMLSSIPWYPAIGDGAAANVGAGCVGRDRIALTVGTSAAMRLIVDNRGEHIELPPRIWCYRLDAEHAVLGGALSNGGNVTGWLAEHLADGDFDDLTIAARDVAPDGHGLTMLPFFAGERSPSWNDRATATISGMNLSTTAADLFRVALESTAYRLAAIYDDLVPLATADHHIRANGAAVLGSPLWLQIIADTLGHSIEALDADAEVSAAGAAICALAASGLIRDIASIDHDITATYDPDGESHAIYRAARDRQSRYESAIDTLVSITENA